jgi:hypothetical protein
MGTLTFWRILGSVEASSLALWRILGGKQVDVDPGVNAGCLQEKL